jgi:hypothetical protein
VISKTPPECAVRSLDSANHIVLSHEPAWQRCLHEMCAFLDDGSARPATAHAFPAAPTK